MDEVEHGRSRLLARIADAAQQLCCAEYGVSIHEMTQQARSRAAAAMARQVAMYLAHVVGGLRFGEIAASFKRDRSTVTHACHVIEDRRDDLRFDRKIELLENAYRPMVEDLRRRFQEESLAERSAAGGKAR